MHSLPADGWFVFWIKFATEQASPCHFATGGELKKNMTWG
jgi:hypothetical protein